MDGKTWICNNATPLLGVLGGEVGIISPENARVHEKYIIGELYDTFGTVVKGINLNLGRLSVATNFVGTAQWGLDKVIEYAYQRKSFGKTIGEHQAI